MANSADGGYSVVIGRLATKHDLGRAAPDTATPSA